ncbi:filament-like plant protein 7 [Canna indica]|uniref:Filament-like plant protein 7 n=1 Tax=Canna indica TaxID=4628 RepID=A0AAQ3JMK1_9LILI|nr:filament-like plant protein 7 [Canna indica]
MSKELKPPNMTDMGCTEAPNLPAAASENSNTGYKININHNSQSSIRSVFQLSTKKSPATLSALNDRNKHKSGVEAGMLMIVPKTQGGISLLRRLLMQRKRKSIARLKLPVSA